VYWELQINIRSRDYMKSWLLQLKGQIMELVN
jgi:hypothetical protein